MTQAGFDRVSYQNLSGGIAALHSVANLDGYVLRCFLRVVICIVCCLLVEHLHTTMLCLYLMAFQVGASFVLF